MQASGITSALLLQVVVLIHIIMDANKVTVTREFDLSPVSTSPTTGKKIQFIRLTEAKWFRGTQIEQKRGFNEVQPHEAQAALEDARAGRMIYSFGPKLRGQTLYEVQVLPSAEYQAEIDKALAESEQIGAATSK